MGTTIVHIKSTFARNAKAGSTIKQVQYFTIHIHTPLKAWFIVLYLFFVLWPGCSIHETSVEVGVSYYYRCYKFIRSVMKRLTSSSSSSALGGVKLGGIVEADEFYIKAGGMKGRPYHLEILNSGRLARRRGLKPWRGRGTYEKENPMIITCIHQRGVGVGGMTYFDVRTKQSLISNICRSPYIVIPKYTQTNIWVTGS
jgi:hypothetical protein